MATEGDSEVIKNLETKCAVTSDILAVLNRQVEKLITDSVTAQLERQKEAEAIETMQRKIRQMERDLIVKEVSLKVNTSCGINKSKFKSISSYL